MGRAQGRTNPEEGCASESDSSDIERAMASIWPGSIEGTQRAHAHDDSDDSRHDVPASATIRAAMQPGMHGTIGDTSTRLARPRKKTVPKAKDFQASLGTLMEESEGEDADNETFFEFTPPPGLGPPSLGPALLHRIAHDDTSSGSDGDGEWNITFASGEAKGAPERVCQFPGEKDEAFNANSLDSAASSSSSHQSSEHTLTELHFA